jgi:integrase
MRPILVVAVETGLRQGELLGLAWEDVGRDTVTVRKELVYRDGRYHREEPKTSRSRRTVPLTAAARAAFDDQAARLRADGYVPIATGPVFTNHRGSALSGSWVTHRLYELEAEAGVRRLPFKNLRSTFASRLHEKGSRRPSSRLSWVTPGPRRRGSTTSPSDRTSSGRRWRDSSLSHENQSPRAREGPDEPGR